MRHLLARELCCYAPEAKRFPYQIWDSGCPIFANEARHHLFINILFLIFKVLVDGTTIAKPIQQ